MRLSQNRIKIIQENKVEGEGHLGINIHAGCFHGPKPAQLLATVYAQFSPEQPYLKMFSNLNLLDQLESSEQGFWFECTNSTMKPKGTATHPLTNRAHDLWLG